MRCVGFLVLLVFTMVVECALAQPQLKLDLDIAGRGQHDTPALGPTSRFSLSRAQLGLSIHADEFMSAHVRWAARRSAPENQAIGLVGESFTPQAIEAFGQLQFSKEYGTLKLMAGLIPSTWIVEGNEQFRYRHLGPMVAEVTGAIFRSDVGVLAIASHKNTFHLTLSSTNGEGLEYRERNNSKNTTLHVSFAPVSLFVPRPSVKLTIEGLYVNGSQGLLGTKSDRVGLRLFGSTNDISTGFEWLKVEGLADDPNYTPELLSAFLRANVWHSVVIVGRASQVDHDPNQRNAKVHQLTIGLGVDELGEDLKSRWQIITGFTANYRGAAVRPIAGESLLADGQTIWVSLGIQSHWSNEK